MRRLPVSLSIHPLMSSSTTIFPGMFSINLGCPAHTGGATERLRAHLRFRLLLQLFHDPLALSSLIVAEFSFVISQSCSEITLASSLISLISRPIAVHRDLLPVGAIARKIASPHDPPPHDSQPSTLANVLHERRVRAWR
jgi:hypothetical protein